MSFFTSRADLNVGIVNQYVLNSNGTIQGSGQQVIGFFDPTGGLPVNPQDGDRYISLATANGWQINDIVVWNEQLEEWKSFDPVPGVSVWVDNIASVRIWDPNATSWLPPLTAFGGISGQNVTTTGASSVPVPAGVTQVLVTLWGAGGGSTSATSGGGSGATVVNFPVQVSTGSVLNFNIGSGGIGLDGGSSTLSVAGVNIIAGGGGAATGATGGGGGSAGGSATGSTGGANSTSYPIKGPSGPSGTIGNGTDGIQQGFIVTGASGSGNIGTTGGGHIAGTASGTAAAGYGAVASSATTAAAIENTGAGGLDTTAAGASTAGGHGGAVIVFI